MCKGADNTENSCSNKISKTRDITLYLCWSSAGRGWSEEETLPSVCWSWCLTCRTEQTHQTRGAAQRSNSRLNMDTQWSGWYLLVQRSSRSLQLIFWRLCTFHPLRDAQSKHTHTHTQSTLRHGEVSGKLGTKHWGWRFYFHQLWSHRISFTSEDFCSCISINLRCCVYIHHMNKH